ncbi:WXG100 family type VII secretion target [Rothia sp. P7181]|uniref:WXG100 family type VII secretion target n=1 Tax=unclassified Rothia (in: high G+C Gram-positive bacteria) TaxID=2689056 RepID=UPI003AC022EA
MAQFLVDAEMISQKSATARAQIDSIIAEVNGLTSSLQDLEGSWTGAASLNFQGVLAQWRATQQQVEQSIAHINEALSRAGVNYADTESANAAMFLG